MKSISRRIGIISLVVLGCCAACVIAAPLFAPEQGLLVLKNGQVIEGGILREGDRYIVMLGERGSQGEIKISADEVDFVCKSLDEAYQRKREVIRQRDVQPHLILAEWCIRQGLRDRAAEELAAAMAIDPLDRRIAELERRLKILAEPNTLKELPKYELPLSQNEIAEVVRTLPDEAVKHFTERVEPTLLNRCAATGCHGPNTTAEYRLIRPPLKNINKLRETQRNTYASLQQIGDGRSSPLLDFATKPHGNSLSPPLDDRDWRSVEQLKLWIEMVRARPTEHVENPRDEHVRPAIFEAPDRNTPPSVRRLPQVEEPQPFSPQPGAKALTLAPSAKRGGVVGPAAKDLPDPFDPAEFNRRYHPEKPPAESSPFNGN